MRRRKCSHRNGRGRGCGVLCRVPNGSRNDGLGCAVEAKVGPWKHWKKRGCSLPRTVWQRQDARRVLDCAVVIVVLLPDSVSVGVSGIVFARFKSLGT